MRPTFVLLIILFSFTVHSQVDLTGKLKIKTVSPEPFESAFQKSFAAAADSKERGVAINQYMDQLHTTRLTEEEKIYLLGEKFKQVVEIDYFGFFESYMRYKIENNNQVIYLKASQALTKEQYSYIKIAAQYRVDEFVAQQNNKPKPPWPAGLPLPGYGWGKTVSSNKTTASVSTTNKPVLPNPVQTTPAPVDELTQLKDAMNYLKGRWVYLSKQQKHFYVPKNYVVNSLTNEIMLKEIHASFTYDSYKSRNVFSVKYSDANSYTLPVKELVKQLTTKSYGYVVTTIYQCSDCLGQGGSWNNNTRKGAICKTCSGSGCVSSQDGGGYSTMPFVNFVY